MSIESNVISFSMKVILNCHWVIDLKTLACIDGTELGKVLNYSKLWLQKSCWPSNNLEARLIHKLQWHISICTLATYMYFLTLNFFYHQMFYILFFIIIYRGMLIPNYILSHIYTFCLLLYINKTNYFLTH